ncbi:MAG: ribosome recycling factor [Armatimonadetes bacterium]|nr:ribosome recycling factor [Armatimonadota bacterium]
MTTDLMKDAEYRMQRAVEVAIEDFQTLRTGRANPTLLDHVMVDYHGTPMPINQLGTVTAPEPRQLLISPWDKQSIAAIEKAITNSDLGLTPSSDGNVIRLQIPYLTEERRKDMVKQLHKRAEDHRIAVRNVRRDVNDKLKHQEKEHEISEDDARRLQEQVQKLTDKFIEEIDRLQKNKETELMEV